nr:poly(ADP-ribose) glycohydrolase ARH3-like [Onthophagus taurus]
MAVLLDSVLMKAKFRGCMLGTLMGDCLGAPFEGDPGSRAIVQKYFDKIDGEYTKSPIKMYTDDTAMTKSIAKCLIDKPPFDYKYLAKLFVKEYFKEPRRGYGPGVTQVFNKLRSYKYEDIYKPAKEQFEGTGSYGNGGAMRISPIPLFFANNYDALIEAVVKSTEITHTHTLGVNGSILQAIAIHQGLMLHPEEKADYKVFIEKLIGKMKKFEGGEIKDIDDPSPYQSQLKRIQKLFEIEKPNEPVSDDEVVACLGNSISALHSVPTAIYCYLRAQNDIPDLKADNPFRRSIQYAISLGGDTDTIAAMTGSIAGAHYGERFVSENMKKHCEFVKEMVELADDLFKVSDLGGK